MPNAGLTARIIKGALYPTSYNDWRTRRMLSLSYDYITENIDDRGPPHSVQSIVYRADLFKVHCLQLKAVLLSEDEVHSSLALFGLEEYHYKYRHKIFNGYFTTLKWLISPQGNRKDLARSDIYVLFSYSDGQRSIVPNETLGVELSTWLEEIRTITATHQTLPAIVGNTRQLL